MSMQAPLWHLHAWETELSAFDTCWRQEPKQTWCTRAARMGTAYMQRTLVCRCLSCRLQHMVTSRWAHFAMTHVSGIGMPRFKPS